MDTFSAQAKGWLRRLALLSFCVAGAAFAQQEADPPGRVAALTNHAGTVVFAPDGEEEWIDLPLHRPLTRGDRVWTDRGARAELHMGATALHLDGQSHLAFFELDDESAQLSLTQGTINVRARDLAPRENLEVDTPNLAVRAAEPGDWRVDVEPDGSTRVAVRSGSVLVFGERGESLRLSAGQQATFEGRDLRQVRGRVAGTDDFDQWVAALNRQEDLSVSARYVPRGVVGYQLLDNHGTWSNDPTYGTVWYPRVVVNDWAPYRYGRWEFIRPWGWTWVDDAPWGFAPFHYGRWARVGHRWAWVPGRFGPRPVYAPALVAFLGNGFQISIGLSSGPGIGWYPLAPGEAWWPTYRTTNVYVTNVNRYIVVNRRTDHHVHRRHFDAITSVRADDFNRRRVVVRDHWRPVRPQDVAGAQVTTTLPRPERGGDRNDRDRGERSRLVATPPQVNQPQLPSRNFTGAGGGGRTRDEAREERRDVREERRDARDDRRDARDDRRDDRRDDTREQAARQLHERQVREQAARQQQERVQERAAQREAERQQREASMRQQQERQERQRDAMLRQQQQQERAQQQQERQQRDAERAQAAREQQRALREQAVRQQQQREAQVERQQERQQRREAPRQKDDDDERRGRGRGNG
jgi:hypothetical protein